MKNLLFHSPGRLVIISPYIAGPNFSPNIPDAVDKPIVFLSHSSRDKAPLAAVKAVLDKRAAGSLDFFLSSDGQSIPFGRNWVVSVSDALHETKLMFVFLSRESSDSKWIHFEAGWAAALNVRVVPVCLPGMDFSSVTPPLSHLQGFNLSSHESMGNLARICNDAFKLRLNELFTKEDVESVFEAVESKHEGFFGRWTWAIDEIEVSTGTECKENETFDPIPKLLEACGLTGVEATPEKQNSDLKNVTIVHLPGCTISVNAGQSFLDGNREHRVKSTAIECTLSPELFHLSAPALDLWRKEAPFSKPCRVHIKFLSDLLAEVQSHKLSTKLYRSGVRQVSSSWFEYQGMRFTIIGKSPCRLDIRCEGPLMTIPLLALLDLLFDKGVLWEDPMSTSAY